MSVLPVNRSESTVSQSAGQPPNACVRVVGMARMWREASDGRRFGDRTSEAIPSYARSLVKREVICVHVCSFTFRFVSKEEIHEYIDFFEAKTHPSSRVPENLLPDSSFRHWHSQRWYER